MLDSLVVGDDFEDSLFDVLTQTRSIDDVSRPPRSFQLLADEQTDVLTAVGQHQLLRHRLTHASHASFLPRDAHGTHTQRDVCDGPVSVTLPHIVRTQTAQLIVK